jgi:uncharacterized membrane protein YbaN (DUF454 family)
VKKVLKLLSGIGLILIGIVGLILPVMPGWVFIIPGLIILAEYFRPIRRLVDWAKKKLEDTEVPGWKGKNPATEEQPAASAKIEDRS